MLSVDTDRLKKCGNDIVKLSNELDILLEQLYSKIYNMPIVTCEWVGASAELFARQAINVDKPVSFEFKKRLCDFGTDLISAANKYENAIKKENE